MQMRWVLYVIVAALQVADVATTEIAKRTVVGFYEANPIVAWMAGQPPELWKLVALKLVVLGIVYWLVRYSPSGLTNVALGLTAMLYVAIVASNINVIL